MNPVKIVEHSPVKLAKESPIPRSHRYWYILTIDSNFSFKLGSDWDSKYFRYFKWGTVPHAGFGLGFDRLVTFVCKLQKIHDYIPFTISY